MITTKYTSLDLNTATAANFDGKNGTYGAIDDWVCSALKEFWAGDILIYGSCEQGFGPWYEGMALAYNFRPFVTDYNPIEYEDKRALYLSHVPKGWDLALSISTFEHSGLGRYGDPLDPDGDLKAMEQVRSVLTPSGFLILSVPLGRDKVVQNLHRIYGRQRLPLLLKGWKIDSSYGYDPDLLDRDTKDGWCPRNDDNSLIHPEYPEYCPVLVLTPEKP